MKIAIAGCTGRMGLTLVKAVNASPGLTLSAGSERPGYDGAAVQSQLAMVGASGLFVTSDATEMVKRADAVIDFTTPDATLAVAQAVAAQGGVHIVGTTGFSAAQMETLKTYGNKARIVQSGNFSLGITVLQQLVQQLSALLDESYDIEISEIHHKHKKDAPSGTALMLGQAAAAGRNVSLVEKIKIDRDGERKPGDIGFSVARGGDVVGIHSVLFAGPGEIIELKHQGFSREIYATGALKAARWAHTQQPGVYSMKDVLGM